MEVPETLTLSAAEPAPVATITGFTASFRAVKPVMVATGALPWIWRT